MSENVDTKPKSLAYLLRNFLWDFVLMLVLLINLLFISWDWFFSIPDVYSYFMEHAPAFFAFYNPIHIDCRFYDLIFVAIYVIDLVVGWSISVFSRKERLYEYPIAHWYDVIGCIPAGTLVFLRLLRLVSLLIRLYKKNYINIHKIGLFRKCIKLYNIVLEEISDRVVLNILGGIKTNIQYGMPITQEIINKIVIPHKAQIIDLVFAKISTIATQEYTNRKSQLASYIKSKSHAIVQSNKELALLSKIPVLGTQLKQTIENSISESLVQVVDSLISDAISKQGQEAFKEITNEVTDHALVNLESELSRMVTDIVLESVNLIARTANIKQWKLREVREELNAARSSGNPDPERIASLEAEYTKLFVTELEKKWE